MDTLPSRVLRNDYLWPARHYPRFRIWHPSSGYQRDFNPPELRAAQRTLCLLLTSAWTSRHLSMSVAQGIHADLPGYCAPTFTLMPVGSTPHRSVQVSGFAETRLLAPMRRLVSVSCSSGQRAAIKFPSDSQSPTTPLPSANTSPCRVCRGLSPPSKCALPGARIISPGFAEGHLTFEKAAAIAFDTVHGGSSCLSPTALFA